MNTEKHLVTISAQEYFEYLELKKSKHSNESQVLVKYFKDGFGVYSGKKEQTDAISEAVQEQSKYIEWLINRPLIQRILNTK